MMLGPALHRSMVLLTAKGAQDGDCMGSLCPPYCAHHFASSTIPGPPAISSRSLVAPSPMLVTLQQPAQTLAGIQQALADAG